MGSGASANTKQKGSTESQLRGDAEFEAIRNINNQIDLLSEASKDTSALDAFIDDTKLNTQANGASTSIDHVQVTYSLQLTVDQLGDYFNSIDDSLDKLRTYLDTFKDAVFERCQQYAGDEQLSQICRVRQQIHILDDVILRARERLDTTRTSNTTSREIKAMKQQVKDLELFKAELRSNGSLSARSAQIELSESDFVVEDIIKWHEEALTMRRKYEMVIEDNAKFKSESENDLLILQDKNGKLVDEIKELRVDINKADETVEEYEAKVQAVRETLLDERLSHEVEINALKAMIEKQDEIIAKLMNKSASTTPAPIKGDVRLSPEGFGGNDEVSTAKTDDDKNTERISSPLPNENETVVLRTNATSNNTVLLSEEVVVETKRHSNVILATKNTEAETIIDSESKNCTDLPSDTVTENTNIHVHSENDQATLTETDAIIVDSGNNKSNLFDGSFSELKVTDTEQHPHDMKEDNEEVVQNDVLMFEEGITKEIMYRRNDGEIDGNLSYHKGVGAVLQTTNKDFGVDSISCEIIDELEINMLPDFMEGERVVSFQLHFQKKYGVDIELQDDETITIFVPHRHIQEYEEASLIQSVDGGDWEPCDLIDDRPTSLDEAVLIVGTKLRCFNDVKLIAIAREKLENIVVEENNVEIVHQSQNDKSVTLKLRANTFDKRTEVKLLVHDSHRRDMPTAVEIHDECKHIVSCTAFVSITSEVIAKHDVDIIMELQEDVESECKYTMFSLDDAGWKLADCDWNNENHVLVIHLRSGFKKYRILGLELPKDTSVEDRLLAVNTLHQHVGHHLVRLLFRQRQDDPTQAVVICLSSRLVKTGIYELKELGYSVGGYPSSQFCLLEGDTLLLQYAGDIIVAPVNSEKMEMTFYPQKGIATKQLSLRYQDNVKTGSRDTSGCLQVLRAADQDRYILGETIYIELEDKTNI